MDYSEMTLDQLNQAAAKHQAALVKIRAKITPDLATAKRLPLELEAAEHRAHLNVIQPLRTQLFVEAEFLRSRAAKRALRLSPQQFERLRQQIAVDATAKTTKAHTPGEE